MEFDITQIWDGLQYPEKLRKHCTIVTNKALEIADKLSADGIKVNRAAVGLGAMLHDIGRKEKHTIDHAVLGYAKCKELGISEDICLVVRNHVGAGLKKDEAQKLGLPAEDFMPRTIEQKIVSYADNLVDNNKLISFEKELKHWEGRWGKDSAPVRRFNSQHEELENYVTSEKMKELEQKSGLTADQLMEKAGAGIAKFIKKNFDVSKKKDPSILFFCGLGNNGGDGFVAARCLQEQGIHAELVVFGEQKTELSMEKLKKAQMAGIRVYTVNAKESAGNFRADIIVDAIFGTGIQGDIKEPIASVIEWINSSKLPKIAIDMPSGINPDTGAHANVFVRPDYTLCIGRVKKGLVGSQHTGEIEVIPIF